MPIRTHNRGHFQTGSPVAVAQVAAATGDAVDADGRLTANAPTIGGATATGDASNPLVTTNTLPAGMTSLVLDEQFIGSSLAAMWHINTDATWGASGNRIQDFNAANVAISAATSGGTGNSLKLTSRREGATFTAGMIETRPTGTFFPVFGMYESRMKMGHMQGFWPAFWLRQRVTASICEVDCMEYFHLEESGKGRSTLHRKPSSSAALQTNVSRASKLFEAPTLTPAFHTWTVSILPEGANVRLKAWIDSPGGTGTPHWNYLDTSAAYWSATEGTLRADYNYGANYFDIVFQGAQIGGSWLGHPDDPKGYSRWLDSCVSGGTKPNACNTSVGGQPIWTDAADYGGVGLTNGMVYEIDYVKVWSAL